MVSGKESTFLGWESTFLGLKSTFLGMKSTFLGIMITLFGSNLKKMHGVLSRKGTITLRSSLGLLSVGARWN